MFNLSGSLFVTSNCGAGFIFGIVDVDVEARVGGLLISTYSWELDFSKVEGFCMF